MTYTIEVAVRVSLIVIIMVALAALAANMVARRAKINRRTRRVMIWVYGVFMCLAYGVTIAIKRHYDLSPATWLMGFCFIGMIISILWHPEGDRKTPPNDGSLGERVIQAFKEGFEYYKGKFNGRNADGSGR